MDNKEEKEQNTVEVIDEIDVRKTYVYNMVCVRDIITYPGIPISLEIGKYNNRLSIKQSLSDREKIVIGILKDSVVATFNNIATLAETPIVKKESSDSISISTIGIQRVRILKVVKSDPFYKVEVELLDEVSGDEKLTNAYVKKINELIDNNPIMSMDVRNKLPSQPSLLCDTIATILIKDYQRRLAILNTVNIEERLDLVTNYLIEDITLINVNQNIDKRLKDNMEQSQKEYILKEKMRAINEELGNDNAEIDEIERKISELNVSEEIMEKLKKDVITLRRLPSQSPDSSSLRKYLDTILELPWGKFTEDHFDIARARQILDEDHSGMEKIKERIIEYIACMKLTGKVNGQIICFSGPPGVGKTSIAKSIARALGRNFVRMSLGGIKDEAEIRGHRKTYVAAMPGRIIYNMRLAKVDNPLFLIDEIDKLGSDYKGDPSSAMLEVLDPEQNFSFRDNYLEVPYDLSKVLFIATANDISAIPGPLRDRMEIIELSGYTANEKLRIAKEHLIGKQMEKHGLKDNQVEIPDETILKIIEEYTFEAGVRNLERNIATICRKSALKILESKSENVMVQPDELKAMLGAPKKNLEKKRTDDEVGVVSGLYYTPIGGGILNIEVSSEKGKGNLQITGQLGDVMKESAQIAITVMKNRSSEYGIDVETVKNSDIHIHVPEGAVKKDGPSAGIALTTALVSQFSGKKVKADLAMTGEIGLKGEVLPIGGLKEKLFACVRSGIKNAIVPVQNRDDIEELPDDIVNNLNITYVSDIREVLEIALI